MLLNATKVTLFARIRKDYPTTGVLKLRIMPHFSSQRSSKSIRKDYPTTGVLKLFEITNNFSPIAVFLYRIRKDYPTTGVLKPLPRRYQSRESMSLVNQEGLPDYWGIETQKYGSLPHLGNLSIIRKDYPTTGVLKHLSAAIASQTIIDQHSYFFIRKDYPTTGVLKQTFGPHCDPLQVCRRIRKDYPTTGVLKL